MKLFPRDKNVSEASVSLPYLLLTIYTALVWYIYYNWWINSYILLYKLYTTTQTITVNCSQFTFGLLFVLYSSVGSDKYTMSHIHYITPVYRNIFSLKSYSTYSSSSSHSVLTTVVLLYYLVLSFQNVNIIEMIQYADFLDSLFHAFKVPAGLLGSLIACILYNEIISNVWNVYPFIHWRAS